MPSAGGLALPFVRRGSILLQRGIELRLGPPPPSLGVSSLDLGRRLADGPFFLGQVSRTATEEANPKGLAWRVQSYSAAAR
jgi:hypothetical protein